ncbi:MAG: cryptochrome/photolyase family protein, partial [Phycisphaerae bacterium]|nr:cryptochrome/photolyase family protein [Phycisphaerae bacterium]
MHPWSVGREATAMPRKQTKAADARPKDRRASPVKSVAARGARAAAQARASAWVLALPDQLTQDIGPLARDRHAGVILVESDEWMSRRPYHRQRLALLLLNAREFAEECRAAGRAVHCAQGRASIVDLVRSAHRELGAEGPIVCMQPAEHEMRAELAPLVKEGVLSFVAHEGWMTTADDLGPMPKGGWRMDAFYRRVRKRLDIMVDDAGRPEGGA